MTMRVTKIYIGKTTYMIFLKPATSYILPQKSLDRPLNTDPMAPIVFKVLSEIAPFGRDLYALEKNEP